MWTREIAKLPWPKDFDLPKEVTLPYDITVWDESIVAPRPTHSLQKGTVVVLRSVGNIKTIRLNTEQIGLYKKERTS